MSVAEIISELPKLTVEERTAIMRRLKELEEQDSLLFLNDAAESMFREMDKREADDDGRKAR